MALYPLPHDIPMGMVVTEDGIVAPRSCATRARSSPSPTSWLASSLRSAGVASRAGSTGNDSPVGTLWRPAPAQRGVVLSTFEARSALHIRGLQS